MKLLGQGLKQEATWCHQNYVPTYDEYMKNGVTASSCPYGVVACFLGMEEATKEAFEWATGKPIPKVVAVASTSMRLLNDVYSHKVYMFLGIDLKVSCFGDLLKLEKS